MSTKTLFRQALKKVSKPQTGWLDVFPAVIGKADGTVLTEVPGEIYVRNVLNGQTLRVHNSVAPNTPLLQVDVGRRVERPGLWQVKGTREAFPIPAGGANVPYHHEQHEEEGPDRLNLNRKQILYLTVRVSDATNFLVRVYGGVPFVGTGYALIANQEVDLSAYVPAIGAVYVNIESDNDGVLTVHEGTAFEAAELATAGDIPVPEAGQYRIATVLLFESMTELLDQHILVPMPLETNPGDFQPLDPDLTAIAALSPADDDIIQRKAGAWTNRTLAQLMADIESSVSFVYQALVYDTDVPDKPMATPTINIEGALAVATGVGGAWVAQEDGVMNSILIYCKNNGSASSTIVDVNKNGTTIFTTSGNRPTFGNTDTVPIESAEPDVVDFVKGDLFTFDIDQIATGAEDLTITPIARGYSEISFVTDDDGFIVTEDALVEIT
jgi:hypothetical protein